MDRAFLFAVLLSSTMSAQQTTLSLAPQPTQQLTQLPRVKKMDVPFYPPLARSAKVQGIVHMQVRTDGRQVTEVQVIEGNKLLADAAEQNVRSWKFYPSKPTSFLVQFTFNFTDTTGTKYHQLIKLWPDSEIRTQLPTTVEITSAPWPVRGVSSPD